ncbi:MAG: ankyrin repeat domain-containing protein [Planctomycetota bacterium]
MKSPRFGLLVTLLMTLPPLARGQEETTSETKEAVWLSLPLLQSSAQTWIEKRTCSSCHHQGVGLMAVGLAKENGFQVDEALFEGQVSHILGRMEPGDTSAYLAGDGVANYPFGHVYLSWALAGVGRLPRDGRMAILAHGVAGRQHDSGSWRSLSFRPPIEASHFTLTALSARLLGLAPMPWRGEEQQERLARAAKWLSREEAKSTEDLAFASFGSAWLGDEDSLRNRRAELLATQRPDGGWAQIPTRQSDAYATGLALVTLHQTGGLEGGGEAYRRGVRFLLDSQAEDGSWHVATRRRLPGLPHFETGFPHGIDQFLSYAATGWATMALILKDVEGRSPIFWPAALPELAAEDIALDVVAPGATPLHRAALFGTLSEFREELAKVDGEVSTELSPLWLALHDPERVAAFLERSKPSPEVLTAALTLASGYSGARESVRQLLAAGASVELADQGPIPPINLAVIQGDHELVDLLLESGTSTSVDDLEDMVALDWAVCGGDVPMATLLLDRGADVNRKMEDGATSLVIAVEQGDVAMTRLLISRGIQLDNAGELGHTPLHCAALFDPGHAELVKILLEAGADPRPTLADGRTALDLAKENHHPGLELLQSALKNREQ